VCVDRTSAATWRARRGRR